MSKTFQEIVKLIETGEVLVSLHGHDELAADDILVRDAVAGAVSGTVVEDYPDYYKGPAVLVLQKDNEDQPIHVVWGIPRGETSPAVIITAYRPNPGRWSEDFLRRK